MGFYINPTDQTKEDFLFKNGHLIRDKHAKDVLSGKLFEGKFLPVCLMDNGPFTAAGIAYDEAEIEAFQVEGDRRPKTWFAIPKKLLSPYITERFLV